MCSPPAWCRVFHRTTGARIASILLAYALLALLGSLVAYLGARPVVESQVREAIARDAAAFAAIQARVDPHVFATLIADRSSVDAGRDVEYALRLPGGETVAGHLPDRLWRYPLRDGVLRFDLPDPARGPQATRRMIGRPLGLRDGARLMIAYDVDVRVAAALRLLWPLTLAIVLTALAGVAAALVFARRGEQQLRDVSAVVGRILMGDLSQRLPMVTGTGLTSLTREINVALDRIEQLTVAMRAVADSTAHDLRAPLNRLRATLEYALVGDSGAAGLRSAVERALEEVERVEMTLEALLRIALAEAGAVSLAPVDLSGLVMDVVDLYRPLAEEKGQSLQSEVESGLQLNCNAQLLAQAFANLIDNAIKYTPRTGRIKVVAAQSLQGLSVAVMDTGPGIAPEDRARALERSRRLANAAGTPGSGLGLALVAAVMRLHGGTIELDDQRPGLRVGLWLRRS